MDDGLLWVVIVVESLSCVRLFVIPWTAARQSSLSITNSHSLLKLMSIKPVMPSNYLILCHPHLLLPSIFPSIRVFSNKSVLHIRWPKYWSFSFSISPSSEYSGLISFRIDWLDLLTVQETLWLNGREHICQSRRHGFDLWLGKIPWRRTWQSTPVFLPGKSCGQRSLVGYSPWGSKRVGHNLMTKQQKQQAFPLFTLLYITEMCF